MGFHYDPQTTPDPRLWLAMDEQERVAAVLAWHEASQLRHPPTPRPTLHAAMHAVVENQAAADDPPPVRIALARLQGAGLDRHAAVHAVASVVGDALSAALGKGGEFDPAGYAAGLEALNPDDWRF